MAEPNQLTTGNTFHWLSIDPNGKWHRSTEGNKCLISLTVADGAESGLVIDTIRGNGISDVNMVHMVRQGIGRCVVTG